VAAPSLPAALWRTTLIFAAVGTLLLMPLPNDYRALWFGATTDLVHVPLFALLTYPLIRYCWPGYAGVVVTAALVVALGAEAVQPLVGRSASWRDFYYGAVGVLIAVVALRQNWPLGCRLLLIALLTAWPLSRAAPVVIDGFRAWNSFPVLADFQGRLSTRRWLLQGARVQPQGDHAVVEFAADPEHGTGMILLPVVRDWTAYERLVIDFSFEGEPLLFLISVRDGKPVPDDEPRFDLWKRYPPGKHHVEIELADLARGTKHFSPIELDRIQSLHLVAVDNEPRTLNIGIIRLEGRKDQ
jgi:hypothetical protein